MSFRVHDRVEFGFFVSRYLFTFAVFCLGIKAPGISKTRDYLLQRDGDEEVSNVALHSK